MTGIEDETALVSDDRADDGNGDRVPYNSRLAADPDVLVYRITGAFFFGAASTVGTVLDSIADTRKAFVVSTRAWPGREIDHERLAGVGDAVEHRPHRRCCAKEERAGDACTPAHQGRRQGGNG